MKKNYKFILIFLSIIILLGVIIVIPKSNWKNAFNINKTATVFTTDDALYNTAVSNNWTVQGHAWGENIGWLTISPNSSSTVYVADDSLSGYLYGENVGWISLSCRNTNSCGTNSYGVSNDSEGYLSGFAYGENVGWINFGTSTGLYEVTISATGTFSGYAYGENVGWINFGNSLATTTWTPKSSRLTSNPPIRHRRTPVTSISTGMGGSIEPEIGLPEEISTSTATEEDVTATSTLKVEVTPTPSIPVFTRNLALYSTGDDVKLLQIYLNNKGFIISTTGAGSKGNETTFYGQKTKQAVIKFQEAHIDEILKSFGLTIGTGFFGESTRNFINNNY